MWPFLYVCLLVQGRRRMKEIRQQESESNRGMAKKKLEQDLLSFFPFISFHPIPSFRILPLLSISFFSGNFFFFPKTILFSSPNITTAHRETWGERRLARAWQRVVVNVWRERERKADGTGKRERENGRESAIERKSKSAKEPEEIPYSLPHCMLTQKEKHDLLSFPDLSLNRK